MACFLCCLRDRSCWQPCRGDYVMASIQTKKHFVEDNTNRPDIGFTVVLITAKHLRGHVKWRP